MPLTVEKREEFNPFEGCFVLCQILLVAGFELKFGDQIPDCCPVHIKMAHFHNGAVGSHGDLQHCDGEPVVLCHDDPLMPIARFADPRCAAEDAAAMEEALIEQPDPIFHAEKVSIENAKLLRSKDDLIAYAAQFDIVLKKATNISLKKMVENLEAEAVERKLV